MIFIWLRDEYPYLSFGSTGQSLRACAACTRGKPKSSSFPGESSRGSCWGRKVSSLPVSFLALLTLLIVHAAQHAGCFKFYFIFDLLFILGFLAVEFLAKYFILSRFPDIHVFDWYREGIFTPMYFFLARKPCL